MSSSSCSYSSPLTFFTTTTATPRVSLSLSQSLSTSSSQSPSSSSSSSLRISAVTRRGFAPVTSRRSCFSSFSYSPHVSCVASSFSSPTRTSSSKVKAMAEMVNNKEEEEEECSHSRTFVDARTEQDLLLGIRKEAEAGRLPSNVARGLEELYQSYKTAVFQSGQPGAEEIVLTNMATAFDRILADVEDSFVFLPHHKAIRAPFDYYMFGQNYIRPLVDFRNSYVGNIALFKEIELQLQQGHNVVLMSNHQSEADPAIIALLLEATNQNIAENLTYIAGDRVITDPLSKPFSMGRNLICVYSKKHMHDNPELVEIKRKANTRSLKEMALLLRSGSQLIWIAPSGGRDRPDPRTEEWFPAPFDSSAVDNMRRLVQHSGTPGHIYPLSILCHDIMPPPPQVEKEIGEKRVMLFSGTGLSVAPEINFADIAAGCETPEEAKDAYSQAMYNSVSEQYNVLKTATLGKQGLEASIPSVSLSQPWNH